MTANNLYMDSESEVDRMNDASRSPDMRVAIVHHHPLMLDGLERAVRATGVTIDAGRIA